MEMLNQYGCRLQGLANINVFPPDMTISISETKCYAENKTLVRFRICMNNSYDSIYKGIPVAFYDADPNSGTAVLLDNSFRTQGRSGNCDTFSAVINTPSTAIVFAVVNYSGGSTSLPGAGFEETDFTNNLSQAAAEPFNVTLEPADTSINRNCIGSIDGYCQRGPVKVH